MKSKSLNQVDIADGTYSGIWGGCIVRARLNNGNESEPIEVNPGVRGINIPCTVIIRDGYASIIS